MHYFIDGYNMLFRLMHVGEDLQVQRKSIIEDLNKKVAVLNLNVSLVFDAHFQEGSRSRSHYDALEILFTSAGETADDYIIDELKHASNPRQETVVTSDKKLAWHARHCHAHTESVETFLDWLGRSYKNKLKRQKKEKIAPPPSPKITPPLPLKEIQKKEQALVPSSKATIEECANYYEQIFESHFQTYLKEESTKKAEEAAEEKKTKRKPKRKKTSFFADEEQCVEEASNEMERWLKAFEDNLKGYFDKD